MASESTIQQYLTAILNATYGSEVRTAIYNSIASCYQDVSGGVTSLDNALSQLSSATSAATEATTSATSAATAATTAKADFDQAKSYYEQAYSEGNSYIQQLTALKTQTSGIKDEAVSAKNAAATSETNASTSAGNALTYAGKASDSASAAAESAGEAQEVLTTINNSYNLSKMDQRLSDLKSLEDDFEPIQESIAALNTLYTDVFVTYNMSEIRDNMAAVISAINNINTYSTEFDRLNILFSSYAETFGGYNRTFSGYAQTFSNDLEALSGIVDEASEIRDETTDARDEVVRIKGAIDAIDFAKIATDATRSIEVASESLEQIEAYMTRIETMDLDHLLDNIAAEASNAETAATRAETAVGDLEDAINAANTAATAANGKVTELTTLQSSLNTVLNLWNNSLYTQIQTSLSSITTATNAANEASTAATTASNTVSELLTEVRGITTDWGTRRQQMDEYLIDAATAIASIDNMTVTSESVAYTVPSSATISEVDGHKNIHFAIQKGEPGPGNVIKGGTYSSLSDLRSAVPNPNEGDQYSVGTSTPYDIYRWTGSAWENQGPYGVSVQQLTNTEIDTIYGGGTVSDVHKYLNGPGLKHFIEADLADTLAGKVDAVSGKGLSTNDFTNAYKTKVDSAQTSITALQQNKVDTITGKGLSTNDFTNTYKNQIDTNKTNIATLTSSKLNSDFSGFSTFNGSEWTSTGLFAVRYGDVMYQLSGSKLVSDLAASGGYITSAQVATLQETISYLGL